MTRFVVLCVLQNFYDPHLRRLRQPTYGTEIINRRNVTYSRFVPYLEDAGCDIRFTECTSRVGRLHTQKFVTDLAWVRRAINERPWDAILAFGRQAQSALRALDVPHTFLPHPTSFLWRRQLILDVVRGLHLGGQHDQKSHAGGRGVRSGALDRKTAGAVAKERRRIHNGASGEYKEAFATVGAKMWTQDEARPMDAKSEKGIADNLTMFKRDAAIEIYGTLPRPLTVLDSYPDVTERQRGWLDGTVDKIHKRAEGEWFDVLAGAYKR